MGKGFDSTADVPTSLHIYIHIYIYINALAFCTRTRPRKGVLTDMLMLKPLPIDRSAADAIISVLTFIAHAGFDTHELAHMLDSLVRVSRRVE